MKSNKENVYSLLLKIENLKEEVVENERNKEKNDITTVKTSFWVFILLLFSFYYTTFESFNSYIYIMLNFLIMIISLSNVLYYFISKEFGKNVKYELFESTNKYLKFIGEKEITYEEIISESTK